jgi:hypothetical protein
MGALVFCTDLACSQTASNVPPSVALTNPPSGALFLCPSIVRLKATAYDVDGAVRQVDFYGVARLDSGLDSTNLLGTTTQPPYNLFLTNVLCTNMDLFYDLSAVATDDQGARSTSATVKISFTGSPIAPRVSIIEPNDGDVFSSLEVLTIAASVVTFDGTENPVYFFSDGQEIGTAAPPYALSVSNLPPGEHLLVARYLDNQLNLGISPAVRIVVKPFALLSTQLSSAGQFSFTIRGLVTGNYFQVEASSNLLNWFPLMSNLASSNSFQFVDPTPPAVNRRFYRAVQRVP